LVKQLDQINKQYKDVQDNIGKTNFVADWFTPRGDKLRQELPGLAQRRTQLEKSLADLNNRMAQVTQAGVIQMPEQQQDDGTPAVSQPPSGDITVPSDTIVVKPEDMQ
jgi:hypothetical protein